MREADWKRKFFIGKTEEVKDGKTEDLVKVLKSCFLYTPASAAPSLSAVHEQRVLPNAMEVKSYNVPLSLHQRDRLRAGDGFGHAPPPPPPNQRGGISDLVAQPREWNRTKAVPPGGSWYRPNKGTEPKQASGEKALGDLMRSVNGGEEWKLTLPAQLTAGQDMAALAVAGQPAKGSAGLVPARIVQAVQQRDPRCASCGIEVPGLLQITCGCAVPKRFRSPADAPSVPAEICAECFTLYKCNHFGTKRKGRRRCRRSDLGDFISEMYSDLGAHVTGLAR